MGPFIPLIVGLFIFVGLIITVAYFQKRMHAKYKRPRKYPEVDRFFKDTRIWLKAGMNEVKNDIRAVENDMRFVEDEMRDMGMSLHDTQKIRRNPFGTRVECPGCGKGMMYTGYIVPKKVPLCPECELLR